MKLLPRRLVNWLAIFMGVLTVGFCLMLWGDDRRYDDYYSCKEQSQAGTTAQAMDARNPAQSQATSAVNLILDTCMANHHHSFDSRARTGLCATERDSLCYSIL